MSAQHSAAHPPVLTAHNLTLTFGKGDAAVHALRGVSATIPQGQWSTIMGPSGSGKTTLLHCLAGLTVPDRGTVTLHGRDRSSTVTLSGLSNNARAKLRRTRIGVVFQEFNLVPVLNVRDNILLPARLAHHRIDSAWQKEVLSHLGLEHRLKHLPHELSGGQRQRVAIARAILTRPDVILADEPTGNLDSTSGEAVLDLFRELTDRWGQTLVMVTHDPHAAERSDGVIRMADGEILSIDATSSGNVANTGSAHAAGNAFGSIDE